MKHIVCKVLKRFQCGKYLVTYVLKHGILYLNACLNVYFICTIHTQEQCNTVMTEYRHKWVNSELLTKAEISDILLAVQERISIEKNRREKTYLWGFANNTGADQPG